MHRIKTIVKMVKIYVFALKMVTIYGSRGRQR